VAARPTTPLGDHRGDLPRPLGGASAATDRVVGPYVHGLFETEAPREAFVAATYAHAGLDRPAASGEAADPYERAADVVADHLDLAALDLA
jgi:adenosylcobyric acid synthase